MDCTELSKIFAGEHEGDLDDAQGRALTDHLTACAACRTGLGEVEDQLQGLATLFEPEPLPEASWERVTAAIREEVNAAPITPLRPHSDRRRSPFPVFLAVAAALFFVAGVVFLNQLGVHTQQGSNTTSSLNLTTDSVAEPVLVEAGEGYEAGYEVEGRLLCLYVREKP